MSASAVIEDGGGVKAGRGEEGDMIEGEEAEGAVAQSKVKEASTWALEENHCKGGADVARRRWCGRRGCVSARDDCVMERLSQPSVSVRGTRKNERRRAAKRRVWSWLFLRPELFYSAFQLHTTNIS